MKLAKLNELLDLTIKISSIGNIDESFEKILKNISSFHKDIIHLLFVIKPFTGTLEDDWIYQMIICRNDNILGTSQDVKYKDSVILKELFKNSENLQINIDNDPYLKKQINDKIDDISFIFNRIDGNCIRFENKPLAFLLFLNQDQKTFLNITEFEIIQKIIFLAVEKKFLLYEERNRVYSTLSTIAFDLQAILDNDKTDVLQCVLDSSRKHVKAEKCALFLSDLPKTSLILERASGNIKFESIRDVSTYPIDKIEKGSGVTPWVWDRKMPFNARNFNELRHNSKGHWKGNWDGPMYGGTSKAEMLFKCVYMVPLIVNNESIGVLKYENREYPNYTLENEKKNLL